jgi:uncharacterized protein (DUF885 family)
MPPSGFLLVSLRRSVIFSAILSTPLILCAAGDTSAQSPRTQLDSLSEAFWQWRATEQPFTNDDIPRIERPANFTVDWSPAAVRRYKSQIVTFETQFRALDMSSAPIADQVDYRLLGSAIARVRWELEIVPDWRRNPFFYVDQSLGSVYVLLLPPGPLSAARQAEILHRLERIPSTLDAGRQNLDDMRGPYVRTSLALLDGIEARLQRFQTAFLPQLAESNRSSFQKDLAATQTALVNYRDWVKSKNSNLPEQTTVGREGYLYFLRNVALLPYSPEEMLRIGRQEWQRSVAFESLQLAADTGLPTLPLFPDLKAQEADSAKQELAIRAYLVSHNIMSVPPEIRHYRSIAIPAYVAPLSFLGVTDDLTGPSRLDQDAVSYKQSPSPQLGFFALASAHDPRPLILHEGVPGHYFQLAWSWHHPDPIRRHYYDSQSNEGLGFYAEEMMLQAGLFDSSPRSKEIIYSFMRLRALRVEVDVRLALGEFTLEQAANYLASTVPMDSGTARSEAAMFASTPGQAITYQVGKQDIIRLMSDVRRKQGDAFSLQHFHDFIWLNGNVPFSLQRWELLGDSTDVPPLAATFNPPAK